MKASSHDTKCLPPLIQNLENTGKSSTQYLKLEEQEGVVPNSCIDLSEALATESRSTPARSQGCFWGEQPLMRVQSRKLPALLCTLWLPAEDWEPCSLGAGHMSSDSACWRAEQLCLLYTSTRGSAEGSFPQWVHFRMPASGFGFKDHSSAPSKAECRQQKMRYHTRVILDKLDSPPLPIKQNQ